MKHNELKILRHLHERWNDVNTTADLTKSAVKMEQNEFSKAIEHLRSNNYIVDEPGPNQSSRYRITVEGCVKVHEISKDNSVRNAIEKYGKIISVLIGIIGAIGIVAQIVIGSWGLYIQHQELTLKEKEKAVVE